MACGADVNATNKWDWTPLHLAATNGMTETALRLVQLGANLYATVRRRRCRATRASARTHARERGGGGGGWEGGRGGWEDERDRDRDRDRGRERKRGQRDRERKCPPASARVQTLHTNLPLDEATGMQHWKTAAALKRAMGPDWYSYAR